MQLDQFQLGLLVTAAVILAVLALVLGVFIGGVVAYAKSFPYGTIGWGKNGTRVILNREPE